MLKSQADENKCSVEQSKHKICTLNKKCDTMDEPKFNEIIVAFLFAMANLIWAKEIVHSNVHTTKTVRT